MPVLSKLMIPTLVCGLALAGCRDREESATTAAAPAAAGDPAARAPGLGPGPAVSGPAATGRAGAPAVDVRPIAGQDENALRSVLGTPLGCEDVAKGRRCTYPNGASEVVFIDGMADHIVIDDLGGAAFEPATIARIGLAGEEPMEVTANAIRWQNVGGMREIVLERGPDGRAGRFVIKSMTL